MNRFGFEETQWEAAKAEGKRILSEYAKQAKPVPYSKFVKELHSIQLEPHDPRLAHLLGEISTEEYAAGRGMLSALVVHKDEMLPGIGFFELAQELGYDIKNKDAFWIEEVKRVSAAWSR
jgi:hypothetical protein